MKGFDQTVLAPLLPVLERERALVRTLESHRVTPQQFLVYVYDRELSKQRTVGIIITIILAGLLFSLAYPQGLAPGIAGALLGLGIGWGALRLMQNKQSRYLDYPDNTAGGFTALGVLNAWNAKKVAQWDDAQWQRVCAHRPNLSQKRYRRLPAEPKTARERQQMTRMTPRKQRIVRPFERAQHIALWGILLCVPLVFLDDLLAGLWGFAMLFLWLTLEGVIGFITRHTGAFAAAENVDVYGWPARVISVILVIIGLMLFLPTAMGFAITIFRIANGIDTQGF